MQITKRSLVFVSIVIIISSVIFTSCKEILPAPIKSTTVGPTKGKTDSIAALDSLPSFRNPTGLAVDASGNIYVADFGNNLIRKISLTGVVSTVAGDSTQSGLNNGVGKNATFNGPAGIAVDASGNLYVTDSGNNLIRKINAAGLVSTLAGGDTLAMANGTGAAASFFQPLGISLDASGNIYVADAGDNAVRLITPSGTVSTFSGNADSSTYFNNPTGLALDANNNIFVANYLNNNILKITQTGQINVLAGNSSPGNTNGPDSTAQFYLPNGIVLDANNNIYIADGINNLIRKITPDGFVSTFAGSGAAGAKDSIGTAATFNGPTGLATDAVGNIYVADTNNNLIRKITPAGQVTTIAGSGLPGYKNTAAILRNTKLNLNRKLSLRLRLIHNSYKAHGVISSKENKSQNN